MLIQAQTLEFPLYSTKKKGGGGDIFYLVNMTSLGCDLSFIPSFSVYMIRLKSWGGAREEP